MRRREATAKILAYTFALMFFALLWVAAAENKWLWAWYGWGFGLIGAANIGYLIIRVFVYVATPEAERGMNAPTR